MNKLNKAVISFRIGPQKWIEDGRFEELMELFDQYPSVTDEIAFFTHDTHSPLPIDVITQRAFILAKRMSVVRQKGFRAGINHLATLGHLNENLPNSVPADYGRIVGIDGTVAQGSLCPNDENVRKYVEQTYRVLALSNPDFIWTDDDMRLSNHYPVMVGCFCDQCRSEFAKETGIGYTRESLRDAFNYGLIEDKLGVRNAWIEHHKSTMEKLFALVERSVHDVNPGVAIGVMPTELLFDGYNYARTTEILAGTDKTDVMWRPGEGFYFDDRPAGLMNKAHSLGRQAVMIPDSVNSIQAEIENFPYQPLKKSKHTNALEGAAYIAAGCTGAAFNVLPMCDETLTEYAPIIRKLADTRPFYDLLVQNVQRSKTSGCHTGWCRSSVITENLMEGDWLSRDVLGNSFSHADEILDLGIPVAYDTAGSQVTLLSGNSAAALNEAEILRILSSGVYMNAQALDRLNAMGYGELTGFVSGQAFEHDTQERLSRHQLNVDFEGHKRDARQSFVWWGVPVNAIVPTNESCETLTELIDYNGTVVAPCGMGLFENKLGGRVCVAGYYPWTFLQSLGKASQIKSVLRWLSKDGLPAYIDSFHKTAMWCRHTESGEPVIILINSSLDEAEDLTLMLKTTSKQLRVFDMKCRETVIESCGNDGIYEKFVLPAINPWDMRMIKI